MVGEYGSVEWLGLRETEGAREPCAGLLLTAILHLIGFLLMKGKVWTSYQ